MIHQMTMPNGLKIIGVESHKSPVVSVQMWVRNGSADERKGDEGLSHFIEHLVFKGSHKYKVGEMAKVVEACGGEINAYTSFDQTVFYVTISKNFFSVAMDVIAEMMSAPLFLPEEIDREREVVIEEIKRTQDSLSRRASRQLFSTLYPNYPYSIPVIGYAEVIRQVPPERIRSFFNERYVPENMFLIVSGDFSKEQLQTETQKYFSNFKKRTPQIPPRPPVTMSEEKKVRVESAPFEEMLLYISWPTVDLFADEAPALDVLGLILGQGASSRLYTKLRLQKNCVNSIGAGTWTPPTRGFFSVSAGLNPKDLGETLSGVSEQLTLLFKEGVTDEEIYKAKINFLSEDAYSLETVGGLARKYGEGMDQARDLHFHDQYLQKIAQITKGDILKVAKKHLTPERAHRMAVIPETGAALKDVEKSLESWSYQVATKTTSDEDKPATSIQVNTKGDGADELRCRQSASANGVKTIWRKSGASPIFNLRMAFLGGARTLSPEKAGLTELLSRLWAAQTKNRSELQMKSQLDSLASSVYAFTGRNSLGLVVDGLTMFESKLAEIFEDIFNNFSFTPEMLEREKKVLREALRSRKDSPTTIASLMFSRLMFGENHPYSLDLVGNEATLSQITTADVEDYLKKSLNPENAVVAVVGDYNENKWSSIIGKIKSPQQATKTSPREHQPPGPLLQHRHGYEAVQKEQSHLFYGFRGLSFTDGERFALQVMESVLSGQGGRLFLELRDKASLAYSVSPIKMEGIETGYFGAYIGCSPEKSETALKMMREEFDKLMQNPIPQEELDRAQNYLVGRHDIDLQKNSAMASVLTFSELYGLPISEVFDYASDIREVTSAQVQTLAQKLFSQKAVAVAVGPREPDFSVVLK